MGRACLTVPEYPSMEEKKEGGGVDDEKVECSVVNGRLPESGKKRKKKVAKVAVAQSFTSISFKLPKVILQPKNSCFPSC